MIVIQVMIDSNDLYNPGNPKIPIIMVKTRGDSSNDADSSVDGDSNDFYKLGNPIIPIITAPDRRREAKTLPFRNFCKNGSIRN